MDEILTYNTNPDDGRVVLSYAITDITPDFVETVFDSGKADAAARVTRVVECGDRLSIYINPGDVPRNPSAFQWMGPAEIVVHTWRKEKATVVVGDFCLISTSAGRATVRMAHLNKEGASKAADTVRRLLLVPAGAFERAQPSPSEFISQELLDKVATALRVVTIELSVRAGAEQWAAPDRIRISNYVGQTRVAPLGKPDTQLTAYLGAARTGRTQCREPNSAMQGDNRNVLEHLASSVLADLKAGGAYSATPFRKILDTEGPITVSDRPHIDWAVRKSDRTYYLPITSQAPELWGWYQIPINRFFSYAHEEQPVLPGSVVTVQVVGRGKPNVFGFDVPVDVHGIDGKRIASGLVCGWKDATPVMEPVPRPKIGSRGIGTDPVPYPDMLDD